MREYTEYHSNGRSYHVPLDVRNGAMDAAYETRCKIEGIPMNPGGATALDWSIAWAALEGSGLLKVYEVERPASE